MFTFETTASAPAQTTPVAPLVRSAIDITPITLLGQQAFPMLRAEDTNEALSLVMYVAAPGDGPPVHIHPGHDETFIAIDEGLEFFAGDTWTLVAPNTVVHVPAGARHSFRNCGSGPARMWVLMRPGGIERFFAELAALGADAEAAGTSLDMDRVLAVYDAYGVVPAP